MTADPVRLRAGRTLVLAAALLAGLGGTFASAGGGHAVPMPAAQGHPTMQQHMAMMVQQLRPLTGRAFDLKWTELMMAHHQMAVDMARTELMHGADPAIRAAAQRVVDTQSREIAQMQGWLKAWTGRDVQPGHMHMAPEGMGGSPDRHFLTGMLPHHQGAIDMSRLVPARTANAQVRTLAAQIIRDQSAELRHYREWLRTTP